jgi:hypothetical protein
MGGGAEDLQENVMLIQPFLEEDIKEA